MTIHEAGTMLTLTNELGALRGTLLNDWDTATEHYFYMNGIIQRLYVHDWTVTPDRTLPTTPGSVVRGDADGEEGMLFALIEGDSDLPWYGLSWNGVAQKPESITNWTLLFDAAEEVSE